MVDVIMEFVLEKMGNYVIEEVSMLMGVKEELEELKKEYMCIQGHLKDVEASETDSEFSKELTKQVLDISYDVEDVFDSYNLKAEERSQRRGLMRWTNIIGEVMDAYSIGGEIRDLKRKILDVPRKRETYGRDSIVSEPRSRENTSSFRVRELRRTRSVDEEELVVGLEDDCKLLLAKLLDADEDKKRCVIAIVGMGGKGKTALARKLYNSVEVEEKFKYRAWTCVSQEYNIEDILRRLIRSSGLAPAEILEKLMKFVVEELEDCLYKLLKGKRYLVVLDDIWDIEAWERLRRALPYHSEGSRVIITTRNNAVAKGVNQNVFTHELRLLRFEESWKLFDHKAFRKMKWAEEDVLKIGKEMIDRCGGLPLAIVLLAGLMRRKRPNEWKYVRDNLGGHLKDNPISISTVFNLSFREMPHNLKLCYLYLSVFPEDYEIDVEMLIRLLVAEGFIQGDTEMMMMEDEAREYIEELIDRSLVEAVRRERRKVISIKLHDIIRDVVVEKAKELNFVNVYNGQISSNTCRRVAVHSKMNEYLSEDRNVNEKMRSFHFVGLRKGLVLLSKLKQLRVLNLGQVRYYCEGRACLPDVIGEITHLRYLGIVDTGLTILPPFISSLRFLQTLDASLNSFKHPTDLGKLTSLRHVIGNFFGEVLIGGAGVTLQTLRSVSPSSWMKLKHETLTNLRDLEIAAEYDWCPFISNNVDVASFSKLSNLRVLTLKQVTFETWHDMDLLFPSLESLTLVGTELGEDLMPTLQKLPRLEDLVLIRCDCSGLKIIISAQGFSQLARLEIRRVRLYELRIEEGAMPSLIELNLKNLDMMGYNYKLMIPQRLLAFARVNIMGIRKSKEDFIQELLDVIDDYA